VNIANRKEHEQLPLLLLLLMQVDCMVVSTQASRNGERDLHESDL
jgi:hypothetical protein